MDFLQTMKDKAKSDVRTIVLPEGSEPRNVKAAGDILKEGIAKLYLLGNPDEIKAEAAKQNVDISAATLLQPDKSDKFDDYVNTFFEMRKAKGITIEQAREQMKDTLYYGVMMVEKCDADGMVAGAIHSTGDTLRPALQILKTAPGAKYVSSFMVIVSPNTPEMGENGTFLFSDIGLTENPDAENLAEIAVATGRSFKALFGTEARVAMLSYSTMGSAKGPMVEKVQEATRLAKEKAPDLMIDGEMQGDAAFVASVGEKKAPNSPVAGKANVLIFPDLNAGNIAVKIAERFSKGMAIGPILQGIKKPINDLSRGCSSDDIVGAVAITAVQAQNMNK